MGSMRMVQSHSDGLAVSRFLSNTLELEEDLLDMDSAGFLLG